MMFTKEYTRMNMETGQSETLLFNESHANEARTSYITNLGIPRISALELVNRWNLSVRFRYRVTS
jgi:hypothetical protein